MVGKSACSNNNSIVMFALACMLFIIAGYFAIFKCFFESPRVSVSRKIENCSPKI